MKKNILFSILLNFLVCCGYEGEEHSPLLRKRICDGECPRAELTEQPPVIVDQEKDWHERILNDEMVCLPKTEYSSIGSVYADSECKELVLWIEKTCGDKMDPNEGDVLYVYNPDHKDTEEGNNACGHKLDGALTKVSILSQKEFYYQNANANDACVKSPFLIADSYLAKRESITYKEENFPKSCDNDSVAY